MIRGPRLLGPHFLHSGYSDFDWICSKVDHFIDGGELPVVLSSPQTESHQNKGRTGSLIFLPYDSGHFCIQMYPATPARVPR